MLRSGVTEEKNVHSMIKVFQTKMRGESIDVEEGKFTTTDYSPTEYNQQTQESFLNMTEEHIAMSFPEILEYFCKDYYMVNAFGKCRLYFTENSAEVSFNGNGLFITEDSVKLKFGGTTIDLNAGSIKGNAKEDFSFEAAGSAIGGSEDGVTGKGKDVSFEGSGKVYTKDGKTYLQGTEIHFDK